LRRIDFRDIALLADLFEGNHVNKMNGLTVRGFNLDRKYNAIYKRLSLLESYGYVSRGFQLNQADTYFITLDGVKFYLEAKQLWVNHGGNSQSAAFNFSNGAAKTARINLFKKDGLTNRAITKKMNKLERPCTGTTTKNGLESILAQFRRPQLNDQG